MNRNSTPAQQKTHGSKFPWACEHWRRRYFFVESGFSSVVLTVVVCVWSRVTSLAVPPISMVRLPVSFMVMLELLTRPLALSNKMVPFESLLFKSAFMILNGKLPPALGPGGWNLSDVSTLIFCSLFSSGPSSVYL